MSAVSHITEYMSSHQLTYNAANILIAVSAKYGHKWLKTKILILRDIDDRADVIIYYWFHEMPREFHICHIDSYNSYLAFIFQASIYYMSGREVYFITAVNDVSKPARSYQNAYFEYMFIIGIPFLRQRQGGAYRFTRLTLYAFSSNRISQYQTDITF